MILAAGLNLLWPTPVALYRFDQAGEVNAVLARAFKAMAAADRHASGSASPAPFYASGDDLMQRIDLPEWRRLVEFLVDRLQFTVGQANAGCWPRGQFRLQVGIVGTWFQISNGGAHHDVHNHGNCSWSGVYYVQVDPAEIRRAHATYGELNGCTRFYGPYLARLGGAYADRGNAYLQRPHVDVEPEAGRLAIFPAYLEHQALPYAGVEDRVIVSFNAQFHSPAGGDQMYGYAPA